MSLYGVWCPVHPREDIVQNIVVNLIVLCLKCQCFVLLQADVFACRLFV